MTDYFTPDGNPVAQTRAVSSQLRAIFTAIQTAFGKVAAYTGNGGKLVRINSGATAQEAMALGTANQVLVMTAAATGYEHKTLSGTSNRLTVTHEAGTITLSTPQDLHTAATPEFAGLTITGVSGGFGVVSGSTWAARTITAGTGCTVTNGNGVSGNPVISLNPAVGAGDVLSSGAVTDGTLVVHADATGQVIEQSTLTGMLKVTSGVPAAGVAGTDYVEPDGALGTPSSGTLTSCTGLLAGGLTATATDTIFGRSTAGAGVGEEITCTAFARSILDDANEATFKATVNLEPGTDMAYLAGSASQAFSTSTAAQGSNTTLAASTAFVINEFGKHRNAIINGGMQVQQGAAITLTNAYQYGIADQFCLAISGGTSISGTDAVSSPNAGVSTGVLYGATAASWTTGQFTWMQRIEAKNTLRFNSKVVTVQAKIYQNTGGARSFNVLLYKPTTTADTFSATTLLQTVTAAQSVPNGATTTITATFAALGATDASLGLQVVILDSAANTVASKAYLIGDVQLEEGSAATQFEHRSYGEELALCQRYYYRVFPGAANKWFGGSVLVAGTTSCNLSIPFPVTMRVAPTALEQSGTAGNYAIYQAGEIACTAVPTHSSFTTKDQASAVFTATITAGFASLCNTSAASGQNAYLGWSARL